MEDNLLSLEDLSLWFFNSLSRRFCVFIVLSGVFLNRFWVYVVLVYLELLLLCLYGFVMFLT